MMRNATFSIPANKFDAFKQAVNADRPDTIGQPVPVTVNEHAPTTHYLIDLPADEDLWAIMLGHLPSGAKHWTRRGVPRDSEGNPTEPTAKGMGEVMRAEGMKIVDQSS